MNNMVIVRDVMIKTLLSLIILLLLLVDDTQNAADIVGVKKESKDYPSGPEQPRYGETPSTVVAKTKDSAFLPCSVANLGDRSVTWMRQRDLHILTAGILTYSADERFKVLHKEGTDEWTLQIKFTTLNDSGVYECHVNSDPKISRQVTLIVKELLQHDDQWNHELLQSTTDTSPMVFMEGPAERHIQTGSVLALTCVIHHPPRRPPQHVLWFHGTTNIDYDSPRGGIYIQTENYPRRTISKVMISNVRESDTGEYSCSPSDLNPTVIYVHVQQGLMEAAVQQSGFSSSIITSISDLVMLMLVLQCILRCL